MHTIGRISALSKPVDIAVYMITDAWTSRSHRRLHELTGPVPPEFNRL